MAEKTPLAGRPDLEQARYGFGTLTLAITQPGRNSIRGAGSHLGAPYTVGTDGNPVDDGHNRLSLPHRRLPAGVVS